MRIPPNFFSIPFGLAGLTEAWDAARPLVDVSRWVVYALALLTAMVWLVVTVAYVSQGTRRLVADLRDTVLSPFVSIAFIVPMILGVELAMVAPTAGRVVVVIFLIATALLGGWLTGQWIVEDIPQENEHPGYFLPTVAGALIGSYSAAAVHLDGIAATTFGAGIISWLMLGSTILNRLFFRRTLAPPLIPTLAIEIAPPAVAGVAYFALHGDAIDSLALALGGYAILMALVQLRFLPLYRKAGFSPAFWSFAFSYATVAVDALVWLRITRPAGATGYGIAVLALVTALLAAIGIRTAVALRRREFVPPRAPAGQVLALTG